MASENMSEELLTVLCDSCSFRGTKQEATSRCDDCSENLCDSCEEIHSSLKATRGHVLKPLNDSTTSKRKQLPIFMFCVEHPKEALSLFCVTHYQMSCKLCKVTKHRKCTFKTAEEKSNEKTSLDEVKLFFERVQKLISLLEDIKDSRIYDKNELDNCSVSVRQEIEQIKVKILAWLDDLERKIEEELVAKERELMVEIDNHIQTIEQMTVQFKEMMDSFENLDEQDRLGKFTLMMKNQEQLNHGEGVNEELRREIRPVSFHFEMSREITSLATNIPQFGQIIQNDPNEIKLSFLNISTISRREDIKGLSNCVSGCTFMPDRKLVICQGEFTDKMIKVLSPEFKVKYDVQLDHNIWDVAAIDTDKIVVTGRESRHIYFFDISTGIVKMKSKYVGLRCYGIDCKNGNLYVSFWEGELKEVRVFTLNGETLKNITIEQGYPFYVNASHNCDEILVGTNSPIALCTDKLGNSLVRYSDKQLSRAFGVLYDSKDNFVVCGMSSNNIHIVSRNGSKDRILLTSADGVNRPYCIAYRQSDKTLVVGQQGKPYLSAFTLNFKVKS